LNTVTPSPDSGSTPHLNPSPDTPDLRQQLNGPASLLSALEAITRWRPFVLLLLTFLACLLVGAVFLGIAGALARQAGALGALFGFIGMLLIFATALVGVNAAGILLADDVWQRPQRTMLQGVLLSLATSHRLVLVLLLLLLVFVIGVVLLAILIFITKIPGIGPLLYAFVYPAGAILIGMLWFAVFWLGVPIAAPAIWNGANVQYALVSIKEVAHYRLVPVMMMLLLLLLLLLLTSFILSTIVLTGAALTLGLSAGILNINADLAGVVGGLFGGRGMGRGGDYLWALGLGSALLAIVITTPVFLVYLKGLAIIHRSGTAGLDLERSKVELDQRMRELKRKAEETKAQAQAQLAAARAAQAAQQAEAAQAAQQAEAAQAQSFNLAPPQGAPTVTDANPAGSKSNCPSCTQPVAEADIFCGHCGYKLK